MKKIFIIKKNYYINKIISEKKSHANPYFIIYKKENQLKHFRFVVSIGKKVGNAVVRNHVKRRIKAIINQKINEIKDNYDILIIIRPNITKLTFDEIEKQFSDLLAKAKLLKSEVYSK